MKFFDTRSVAALALTALLTACGGGTVQDAGQVKSAALVQTVAAADKPASGGYPAPDCAPEGCSGLRIIDGNAEAYRADALRRAAAQDGQPGQS